MALCRVYHVPFTRFFRFARICVRELPRESRIGGFSSVKRQTSSPIPDFLREQQRSYSVQLFSHNASTRAVIA